ncbi:MAG: ATP phosphoribosyltransferase regulatory subunit [Nanoarchaeota archaeon]
MELKIEKQAKGVRIITGEQAKNRREVLNKLIDLAQAEKFEEIILPSVEPEEVYTDKAGPEILGQMYVFPDKSERKLCLRPEGTATVQLLANKFWKEQKDVKLWYFERCWRYERPQAGRYREFFQFGVEWINPRNSEQARKELLELAKRMCEVVSSDYECNANVKRGLSYYVEDGFEISFPSLGAQKQVAGGGAYKEGIGFAIGFDRLMMKYE